MSEKKRIISMALSDVFENGMRCYNNNDYKGAALYFENYLLKRNDPSVLYLLFEVMCNDERYSSALEIAYKLADSQPESDKYRFALAKALALNGKFIESEVILLSLRDTHPLNIEILEILENIYRKRSDKFALRRTLILRDEVERQIYPLKKELSYTIELASTLLQENKVDEAKILIESVLSLDPENLHGNGLMAMLFMDVNDYEKAIVFFDRIRHKMTMDYYEPYAFTVEKIIGGDEAIKILEEAKSANPTDDLINKKLAIYYYDLKNYNESFKAASKIKDVTLFDRQLYVIKAISRFQALESKGKWINVNALKECGRELIDVYYKYPDDELISFSLMKFYINIGELKKAYDLLCESNFSDLDSKEWNKHFYYLAVRDKDLFFKSYLRGYKSRLNLSYDDLKTPIWKGQPLKDKEVVIMREQGIGDELLFAHNYNWVISSARKTSIFSAERLNESFSRIFAGATIYPVAEENGTLIYPENYKSIIECADYIVLSGDVGAYLHINCNVSLYNESYFHVDYFKKAFWSERIINMTMNRKRPKVGLIWRGGFINGMRSSHYLNEKEVAQIVIEFPNVDFFNCMYVECGKELNYIQKKSKVKIYHFDDLDQKNDFENTAAMLSNLDLLVGAYTASLSLAAAVGTPILAYAADYIKEDGIIKKEPFYYSNSSHISLPINDKEKRKEALGKIISEMKLALSSFWM